jgi:hypothetical protein
MTIEFHCHSCQQLVRVAATAAGKRGKCPHCGTVVQIPSAAPPAAATRPSPTAAAKPATVSFPCPGCQRTINAPAALAGKKGKCPHCQTVFVVGGGTPAAPSAPAPALGGLQPLGDAGLQPLGDVGLQPLDSSRGAPSNPLGPAGLAPLGAADDLFASLPVSSQPPLNPLPTAPSPLGYTPSAAPFASAPASSAFVAPNPYASPAGYGMPAGGGYRRPAYAPVKLMIPAIAMLVIAVISIGWLGYTMVSSLLAPMPPQFAAKADNPGYKAGYVTSIIVVPGVGILINIGVIAGAIQMIRLRGWDTARGGAVAACMPFCSLACLNMPFGIWALVVLFQPDVKRLFQ